MLYAAERQQRILDEARRHGRVEVNAVATELDVTPETVRRDLTHLEGRGLLRRVHGGAIPVERLGDEPSLATRSTRLTAEKKRIAARALDEIEEGATVLLDAGSTTGAIAELLPSDRELTVVTNSVQTGALLAAHDKLTLFVVGGRVRNRTGATVGEWAGRALRDITVDVAFIGTNGVTPEHGLTTPDQAEGTIKRAMVGCARRVVAVADASKFGVDHFHGFADLAQLDRIITDDSLDRTVAAAVEALGPEVTRA